MCPTMYRNSSASNSDDLRATTPHKLDVPKGQELHVTHSFSSLRCLPKARTQLLGEQMPYVQTQIQFPSPQRQALGQEGA